MLDGKYQDYFSHSPTVGLSDQLFYSDISPKKKAIETALRKQFTHYLRDLALKLKKIAYNLFLREKIGL